MIQTNKVPIRGWLLVFAISIWVVLIVNFLLLVDGLPIWSTASLENKIMTIQGFINIPLGVISVVLLSKRKRFFVAWTVGVEVYACVVETVYVIVRLNTHEGILLNSIGYLLAVLIVLYVLRSRRVKETLVY